MTLKIVAKTTPVSDPAHSFASIQQVRAYWDALRSPGGLPNRDQIDPRGLSDALEKVFLIERIAPGHARFRIAGTQLHDLLGMDLRGMPLSALMEPSARARLSEAVEQAFTTPAALDLWLQSERGLARAALSARMVLLPLAGTRNECRLVLGCLAVAGAIGRAPRRFSIAGIAVQPIGPVPMESPRSAFERLSDQDIPLPHHKAPMLRLVSSRD